MFSQAYTKNSELESNKKVTLKYAIEHRISDVFREGGQKGRWPQVVSDFYIVNCF